MDIEEDHKRKWKSYVQWCEQNDRRWEADVRRVFLTTLVQTAGIVLLIAFVYQCFF